MCVCVSLFLCVCVREREMERATEAQRGVCEGLGGEISRKLSGQALRGAAPGDSRDVHNHPSTHTHIYVYIYVCVGGRRG